MSWASFGWALPVKTARSWYCMFNKPSCLVRHRWYAPMFTPRAANVPFGAACAIASTRFRHPRRNYSKSGLPTGRRFTRFVPTCTIPP